MKDLHIHTKYSDGELDEHEIVEEVFKSGSTALALCASASYPPFFKPVVINGKRYVDGAFANSVPADKVREMGADVVIGIDLATHNQKLSFLSRIIPTYQGKVKEPWKKSSRV